MNKRQKKAFDFQGDCAGGGHGKIAYESNTLWHLGHEDASKKVHRENDEGPRRA